MHISQSRIWIMILSTCFVTPCLASGTYEEDQFSAINGSASVSCEQEVADTQNKDNSGNIYECGDSQEILTLTQSVRQETYDEPVPPFAKRTDTSYSNITLEKMKFKWHVSLGFSGFAFYFETDITTAKPNIAVPDPIFDFSSFKDDVEWVLV